MSVPGSSFRRSAAGRRFQLLSVKRATRSISRRHPSQILSPISRPITHCPHPPGQRPVPFSAPGSSCATSRIQYVPFNWVWWDQTHCVAESRPPRSMKVLLRGVKDAHVLCIIGLMDQSVTVTRAPLTWRRIHGDKSAANCQKKCSHFARSSIFSDN